MKRNAFLLCIILLLGLTACGQDGETPTVSDTSAISAESTASAVSEAISSNAEEGELGEAVTSENTESITIAISEPNIFAKTESKQTTTSKHATSTPPAPPTSTPSQPTSAPTTTEPPKAFDPQPYKDYAVSYGKSIGLIYEPEIGNGNWNSPLNLYAALTDEQMKKGIRSGCDVLITEGFEYFWVSVQKVGDQSYQLFIYFG
jgi:hypothetical protein